ncbi:hypothetical protein Pfo_024764 [Paulownia fortunei]|nr:hypothetical protein Pfo_024764 [Paulownia fortunei]
MQSSRILALMTRKTWIVLLLILLSTSKSEGQKGIPSGGLLCVSECDTCPVVCSPPPSTPKSPPRLPPTAHHSPPEPKYIDSPPPAHPAPPSPSDVVAIPPPPALYVYNPGTTVPPGMVQQNFSYPYYYFYSSKAATCSLPLHQGSIIFVVFMFFQVLYACR